MFSGAFDTRMSQRAFLIMAIIISFGIYCGNVLSHRALVEDRGVVDDICYLRQAHLFRTLGPLRGLNTDHEGVRYVQKTIAKLGLQNEIASGVPCHSYIAATDKTIIQYPPGTGAILALFAPGYQTSGVYLVGSLAVLMMLVLALLQARNILSLVIMSGAGWLTLYLMVNPSKASYSMALTMPLCMALAFVTVRLFSSGPFRTRYITSAIIGILLGVAITVRLSSTLLGIGFAVVLSVEFLRQPSRASFLSPVLLGAGALLGALPTLFANWINTKSPFSTGYTGPDVAPPQVSSEIILPMLSWYLGHTHGALLFLATAALVAAFILARDRRAIAVAAVTLATNLAYFVTHPGGGSQYYSIPPVMFGLWTAIAALAAPSPAIWPKIERTSRMAIPAVVGIIAVAAAAFALATRTPLETSDFRFPIHSVVWTPGNSWAEGNSRHIEYALNLHAATGLDRLTEIQQNGILAAVASDGRPQYLIAGSPAMVALIYRTRSQHVGELFGNNVYRVPETSVLSWHNGEAIP